MDTPRIREKKKKLALIAKPWQVGIIIKVEDLSEPVKDFLEVAKKEQRELDESMRESFRQRDERKAKEMKDDEQAAEKGYTPWATL